MILTESKEPPTPSSSSIPGTPTSAGALTPTQSTKPNVTSGVLAIRVVQARGLTLPPGANLPSSIQQALAQRQHALSNNNGGRASVRESLQRKQMWWLPYIVLEFDKNEIMVDALGGELDCPVWHYKARL